VGCGCWGGGGGVKQLQGGKESNSKEVNATKETAAGERRNSAGSKKK
jgi:hypothetical protein